MLPQDDDRRTLWLCAAIAIAPVLCAAAQVTSNVIVEKYVFIPAVVAAMKPAALFNACLAGGLAAWAAVSLPGGRFALTIVAAISAFVVGAAIYAVSLGVLSLLAAVVI